MNKFKSLSIFLFAASLILGSCSTDDNYNVNGTPPVMTCDNSPEDLLVLSTSFLNSSNATINYSSFGINNLDISQPNSYGDFSTSTDLYFESPTSNSLYNATSDLHGIMVTRVGKYFTYNTTTGIGQEFTTPVEVSAPVEHNNSGYVIEIPNSGEANLGVGNHYEIKSFDIHDGTIGAALPIDPMTKSFDNNSFFRATAMNSATDGNDELYFLSGTNLVTVNTSNNTASHLDLYPAFGYGEADYVTFYGLEYSESLGLIAIMDFGDLDIQTLIQIDLATGSYTDLLTIPSKIKAKFNSSSYRECDQTYYLTSIKQTFQPIETLYFEFDLASKTVENTQIFSDYVFGIELMP